MQMKIRVQKGVRNPFRGRNLDFVVIGRETGTAYMGLASGGLWGVVW